MLLALVMWGAPSSSAQAEKARVGQPAPQFDLPNLFGEQFSTERFRGKPLILVVGTSTQAAEACRNWMLALEKNFRGEPVNVYQVIVLNSGWYVPHFMVINRIKEFVPAYGHRLVLLEWKTKFRDDFHIPYDHIPRVIVMDGRGIIRSWHEGAMNDQALLQVMTTAQKLAQKST